MKFFIDLDSNAQDRFDLSKFMEFSDNYDPLNSAILTDIKSLPIGGQYNVHGEDGRPDMISHRIYGNSQYWWVILLYNSKLDYNDIATGDVLNFPSISGLEEFYFSLKSKAVAVGE